jgi:acetylornithine deacetylase/succinyl-diaminopimelate desuccinylase-like protein
MIQTILDHLAADREASLGRLKALLSIPSISTDPQYASQVASAADHVKAMLTDAGMNAQVHPTQGHPIVLADNAHDDLPANAPHVLFYGHYDVQPPDPLEKWTTPPFEPAVRDGAIYARGASDDKGQVVRFIEALRAWRKVQGRLPVRVSAIIEGEEESSSHNLAPFLRQHKAALAAADVVLICDTTMWNPSTVAITYGLRGLVYFDIQLHNANRDLHSGIYGGTLANPCTTLTQILARLFDENHRVAIPGFYDDVLPPEPAEGKNWAKLNFNEIDDLLGPIGVDTPYGEKGFSTLQRKWARPACDINGLYGGYGGQGAKTVIPACAGAKISFRIAPNQKPEKIAHAFEQWLRSQDTHGCTWRIENLGQAHPVITPTDSPYIRAAQQAVLTASGRPAVLVREGATIPVVGDFKTILGLDSILVGFGLIDDCIHSPNEKFNLSCYDLGKRTLAMMIQEMAKVKS